MTAEKESSSGRLRTPGLAFVETSVVAQWYPLMQFCRRPAADEVLPNPFYESGNTAGNVDGVWETSWHAEAEARGQAEVAGTRR